MVTHVGMTVVAQVAGGVGDELFGRLALEVLFVLLELGRGRQFGLHDRQVGNVTVMGQLGGGQQVQELTSDVFQQHDAVGLGHGHYLGHQGLQVVHSE